MPQVAAFPDSGGAATVPLTGVLMDDLPTFTSGSMQTSSTSGAMLSGAITALNALNTNHTYTVNPVQQYTQDLARYSGLHQFGNLNSLTPTQITLGGSSSVSAPVAVKPKLRVCRVFLVDCDERIPVDKRIIYRTDELITESDDRELFFDIPVKDLLAKHNDYRKTVEWEEKTADGTKTRTGLKEIRIRDLIMSVTTIAEFAGRTH